MRNVSWGAASFSTAFVGAVVLVTAAGVGGLGGCGSSTRGSGFGEEPAAGDASDEGVVDPNFGDRGDSGTSKGPCVNLECKQQTCSGGGTTSVTGTIYDPGGNTPLYNVIVYVPNAPVDKFTSGATCDKCGSVASGSPIATALTNAKGQFKLDNVPVGNDIPLVIQVGRWRRQITIPKVDACKDNPLTDKNVTRLPRNQAEGDLPLMALTTGEYDALECLFRKIGIDDKEFTTPTGGGRMHIYKGYGGGQLSGGSPSAVPLWANAAEMKKYDMMMLSCEGDEHPEEKPQAALDAMRDYANAGGRLFGTHYHYYWFKNGPAPLPQIASWSAPFSLSSGYSIDTTFPKGNDFADWLVNVGASTTRGNIALTEVANDVGTPNAAMGAQRWIYQGQSAKYFSFNTPLNTQPDNQCGRVVFSDVHVSSGDTKGATFPTGCTTKTLTPQEKALEFLFFDLAACVQDDTKPPKPPVPK
jgi:hypothetical protein